MSGLIKTVSFEASEAKSLEEKLREHLGIQEMEVVLSNGHSYTGVITEIGKDYICLIHDKYDVIVPKNNLLCLKYKN